MKMPSGLQIQCDICKKFSGDSWDAQLDYSKCHICKCDVCEDCVRIVSLVGYTCGKCKSKEGVFIPKLTQIEEGYRVARQGIFEEWKLS